MTLILNADDLAAELSFLAGAAERYLVAGDAQRLADLAHQLHFIKRRTTTHEWQIPVDSPIETSFTAGFQRADRGHAPVSASFSTTWQLQGTGDRTHVRTAGNVSSVVRLSTEAEEIALFRMELGASDSPGCYFHLQVEQDRPEGHRWPHWLDVPRFPGLVPTPATVLEFVLGELWQDEWPRTMQSVETTNWVRIQRRRWREFLSWQQDLLTNVDHSPWLQLKSALPDARAF